VGDLLLFGSSKWHWHNLVRTHQFVCEDIQISQLPKKEFINEVWIVGHFLALSCIESSKSLSWARLEK